MTPFIQCLSLILLILPLNLFSQSLSIHETLAYLNKISIENFFNRQDENCKYKGYYDFSIEKNGTLVIHVNSFKVCKTSKLDTIRSRSVAGKFNIADIDVNKTLTGNATHNPDHPYYYILMDTNTQVYLKCTFDQDCIQYDDYKADESNKSWMTISTSNRYNKKRMLNALIYLFAAATEQGYHRIDLNDPFASSPRDNKPSVKNKATVKSSKRLAIPLKYSNGVFYVSVQINGIQYPFILDSGASETTISEKVEKQLVNRGLIKPSNYLSNGLYKLADGSIVESRRVRIPKITVGNKTIFNVVAAVNAKRSPNLLGQSFLNKINSWTIDNANHQLIIY